MNALSIISGLPISDEKCLVIAQPNQPDGQRLPISIVFELPRNQNQNPITIEWIATHIINDPIGKSTYFVSGPNGRYAKISDNKCVEDVIDHFLQDGPDIHGEIRSVRRIKDIVCAVGMGRQVYQRVSDTNWQHIDRGTIDSMNNLDISGFNDVDGITMDLLYAVGFNGEIWKRVHGRWERSESPTNAVLYALKVLDDIDVIAVGQRGVIIRGSGTTWKIIDQHLTEDDFWNLEYFNKAIYLATKSSIFRLLNDNSIEKVELGRQAVTCKVLKLYKNSLWSFGESDILKTNDGKKWTTVFSYQS